MMTRSSVSLALAAMASAFALFGCNPLRPTPSGTCCDPQAEPGVGDLPPCIEGATCCADGNWACNEGDGSSTCDAVCMARSCSLSANDPCRPGEFCKVEVGRCTSPNGSGICEPRPDVCAEIFQPVCGCDGTTYGNECQAHVAGISVAHDGECGQACGGVLDVACPDEEFCRLATGLCLDPEAFGVCTSTPDACVAVFEPVCGCDGTTYGNECQAWSAGVSVAALGACE